MHSDKKQLVAPSSITMGYPSAWNHGLEEGSPPGQASHFRYDRDALAPEQRRLDTN